MLPNVIGMPVLENQKHEAFAQEVAEGASATTAYRVHIAVPATRIENCMSSASRLMADAKVASRVSELRRDFSFALENRLGVRRETLARFLVSVIETPPSEVDANSPLCQEHTETTSVYGTSRRTKMPSKLDAVEKLIKMAGWYAPQKIEHSGGIVGMFEELTGAKKMADCGS